METGILHLHSYLPYLFLSLLVICVLWSLVGWLGNKPMSETLFTLTKVTFIISHVQLAVGLILFVVSSKVQTFLGSEELMSNPTMRRTAIEHPATMIIGIILISIAYIKSKRLTDLAKNKRIALLYGIALVLFLSMIPWDVWPK